MGPRTIARLKGAGYRAPTWPFAAGCVQVPLYHGRIRVVDRRFVAAAHRRGLHVHVWTIDEPAEMDRLLDLGVDGIMTDRPVALREVLERRGQWVERLRSDRRTPSVAFLEMDLTGEQRRIVDHGRGRLRVVGGAGSGKTTALVARYRRLVDDGARPSSVLVLCRTRAAADRFRDAVLPHLAGGFDALPVTTFFGLAYDLVSRAHRARHPAHRRRAAAHGGPAAGGRGPVGLAHPGPSPRAGGVRGRGGRRAAGGGGGRGRSVHPELAAFAERYRQALAADDRVDASGLLAQAADLLGDPDVAAAARTRAEHVLVDDYEAATGAMETILERLGAPDVVVAGDPDGAVGGFPGADRGPLTRVPGRRRGRSRPGRPPVPPAGAARAGHHPSSVDRAGGGGGRAAGRPPGRRGLVRHGRARPPAPAPGPRHRPRPRPPRHPRPGRRRWPRWPTTPSSAASSTCSGGSTATSPPSTGCWCRPCPTSTRSRPAGCGCGPGWPRHPSPTTPGWLPWSPSATTWPPGPPPTPPPTWPFSSGSRLSATSSTRDADDADDAVLDGLVAFLDALRREADRNPHHRLADMLAVLDDEGVAADPWRVDTASAAATSDAVTVTSILAAAGREWHTVVVAGCVEGELPSLRTRRQLFGGGGERGHADLAEERRLFALACSRATGRLVATAGPEPGVLLSRFVEGWPTADARIPAPPGRAPSFRRPTANALPIVADAGLALSATQLDTYDDCPLRYAYRYVLRVRDEGGVRADLGTPRARGAGPVPRPGDGGRRRALTCRRSTPWPRRCGATTSPATGPRSTRPAATSSPCSTCGGSSRARATSPPTSSTSSARFDIAVGGPDGSGIACGARSTGSTGWSGPTAAPACASSTTRRASSEPRPGETDDNIQLAVYHLAATRDPALAAHGPVVELRLLFLRSMHAFDQEVTAGHAEATERRVLDVAARIRAEEFEPSVDANCRWCEFQRLCPIQPEGRQVESTWP